MKPHPAQIHAVKQRFWKKQNTPEIIDAIIDRSPAQKKVRLDKLSAELSVMGYSIVTTEWLRTVLDRAA